MVLAFAWGAPAIALEPPKGPEVLLMVGEGLTSNAATGASFDIEMLEALPQDELSTSTPWYDGVSSFSGPRLSTVLSAIGASAEMLRLVALDGYVIDIPVTDAEAFSPILATQRDGAQLTVRERGPVWLIYPLDDIDADEREIYEGRSVWQLTRIELLSN